MSTVERRTSFLQVPNVFFETCALPESAQILFLRLAAHLGKHHLLAFTGSTRQIATLVHMSKSTVNRMLDVLIDSELITATLSEGLESSREVMSIEVNIDRLWDLNIYHTAVAPVPSWDKVLPDCLKLGRDNINMGHDISFWDTASHIDIVASQAQAQIQDNTFNTKKTKEIQEERETPAPVAHPPTSSTPKPFLSLSENSSQKVPTLPAHLLKKAKGVS